MEAVVIGQKMAIPSYLGGSFDPNHPKSQRSYSTHVRKGSTNGQQTRAFADGFLLVNYFVVMILKLGYKAWLFYFWGSA
jgi:hypothetical protein